MFAAAWLFIVVLFGALVVLLAGTASLVFGRVDLRRLDRFAVRQSLVITPQNGNMVIRYLATTRRWRGGLLYLVLVSSVVLIAFTGHRFDIDLVVAFSGWFVGAVIAEWRVDLLARGPAAAALLHRRQLGDYVYRRVLALAAVVWAAAPVLAVTALIEAVVRSTDRVPAALGLATELLAGTMIFLVVRRVLERPQPLVTQDLLEADNAIRGRSLNVLAGCALAIGGYFGASSMGEIVTNPYSAVVGTAHFVGFVALPILGVMVGRAPRMVAINPSARPLAA